MPNTGLSELGSHLKATRNDRGFTLEQLAEVSGLSARHIANIEKGDVNPSFEVLVTIAKVLDLSFDALFFPASGQTEAELQELTGLYLSCPEQGRRLILASVHAIAKELTQQNQV